MNKNKHDLKEIGRYPMHEKVYVQGAEIIGDKMFMSSGRWEKSFIGFFEEGRVENKTRLEDQYFAEGLTYINDTLYLLTYKSGVVFKYKVVDGAFERMEDTYMVGSEGWGLTNDGKQIIMSDGSDKIFFRNVDTFEIEREICVRDNGLAIYNINELEYANGYIYANVWKTNYILKIDPKDGNVVHQYDLSQISLIPELIYNEDGSLDESAVLNGIAHISGDRFYIFGKMYDHYYIVDLK